MGCLSVCVCMEIFFMASMCDNMKKMEWSLVVTALLLLPFYVYVYQWIWVVCCKCWHWTWRLTFCNACMTPPFDFSISHFEIVDSIQKWKISCGPIKHIVNALKILLICFYATNIIKLNYSKASIELSPAFFEMPNLITHFWAQATLATHSTAVILYGRQSNWSFQNQIKQYSINAEPIPCCCRWLVFQPCAP